MNGSKPVISVIMPVRNGSISFVKRALSSVFSQTYEDYEILLVDDGSRPGFSVELETLAGTDRRIRLFHIKPSGVSRARNFAAGEAKGDIITYLDGDDAISPYCFEEALYFFEDEKTDAVWGGTVYTDNAGIEKLLKDPGRKRYTDERLKRLSVILDPERIHRTRAECIAEPFRFGNKGGYINRGIAARFIRKRVFDEHKAVFPPGINMYEDTIWNLGMTDLNLRYVKAIWYYYQNNGSSVSNRYNKDILKDMEKPVRIIRKMLDTGDEREYAAYTGFLMDSLRYVYKCMYGNPLWDADAGERKRYISHIYNSKPWKEISCSRFIKAAGRSDKIKAFLFRSRLLFLYWKLKWEKM